MSIRCARYYNGMTYEIAHYIIPLGGKISKDGTAMYEAVSTIFLAQVNKRSLRIHDICVIG